MGEKKAKVSAQLLTSTCEDCSAFFFREHTVEPRDPRRAHLIRSARSFSVSAGQSPWLAFQHCGVGSLNAAVGKKPASTVLNAFLPAKRTFVGRRHSISTVFSPGNGLLARRMV